MAEGICTHFTKRVTEAQKRKGSGLPWWSSGLDSTLAAQGAGVPSLEGVSETGRSGVGGRGCAQDADLELSPSLGPGGFQARRPSAFGNEDREGGDLGSSPAAEAWREIEGLEVGKC